MEPTRCMIGRTPIAPSNSLGSSCGLDPLPHPVAIAALPRGQIIACQTFGCQATTTKYMCKQCSTISTTCTLLLSSPKFKGPYDRGDPEVSNPEQTFSYSTATVYCRIVE